MNIEDNEENEGKQGLNKIGIKKMWDLILDSKKLQENEKGCELATCVEKREVNLHY